MPIPNALNPSANVNPFDAENALAGQPPAIPASAAPVSAAPAPSLAPVTQPSDIQKPAQSPLQRIGSAVRTVGTGVAHGIEDLGSAENPQYQVDPQTGIAQQIARTPSRNIFKGILSVALAALSGAGAGADSIARNPRAADSGIGAFSAGARAGVLENYNRNQAARQQAQDNFEQQQKQTIFKSQVAAANISNVKNYFTLKNSGLQHDITHNNGIADAFSNAGYQSRTMSMDDIASARQSDSHWTSEHLVLPLGWAPVMQDGQALYNADTTPRQTMQAVVIDLPSGVDAKNENIMLPANFASKVQQDGEAAGIRGAKLITDETEVSPAQFLSLLSTMNNFDTNVAKAWQTAAAKPNDNVVFLDNDKAHKSPMLRNPVSGELRPYLPGAGFTANLQKTGAETRKDNAEANAANQRAKNGGGSTKNPYTAARTYVGHQISQIKSQLSIADKQVDIAGKAAAPSQLNDLQFAQKALDLAAIKGLTREQAIAGIRTQNQITAAQKKIILEALGE